MWKKKIKWNEIKQNKVTDKFREIQRLSNLKDGK